MAKFLFDSTFEEVYGIVAGVVGTFLQDHVLPSEEELQQTLYPVARVVQSIAATKWRDSLAKNFVQVLYVQAGTAAKSIAGPLKDLMSLADEAVVQQVLTLADRLMQLYQLFCSICQVTLTMAVCAPSTKTYITSKLQATINFCGFTPVANQVLSLMSREAVVAKRFFLPFQENRIVYADMKRHRNFFRCLLHSGGPVEVEKLYKVMEEEVVLSQFHEIAAPSTVWQGDASAFAAVEHVHHLSRLVSQAKTVIDGGWMTFSRLILAPERALLHSFEKFDAAESLALGKCLAFALNHLLSPKARATMRYPPSFVTTLIDGIQLLLHCVGYEEIVFYFQQFFVPHFFFRIVQDDFTSVAEERSTLKQFAVVSDAVEGLFNQMELFSKVNSEFARYLMLRIDNSGDGDGGDYNIDCDGDCDSGGLSGAGEDDMLMADDFLLDAAAGKALHIRLFKDSQVPAQIVLSSFATLRLPPSIRQVMRHFSTFCHGHGVENASRIRWCLGLGRMEITCSVHYRACFTLIVNEPQYAALACLAQYLGDSPSRGITLGFLAKELHLSVEVTRHIVASFLACREVPLLVLDDNHGHALSETSLLKMPWSQWVSTSTAAASMASSPWSTAPVPAIDLYELFWQSNEHAWRSTSSWREAIIDAAIIRQLKRVMSESSLSASSSGAKDTMSELELANAVATSLAQRHCGQLFREEEIMLRAKRLRKRGLISTSMGSSYPPFKTPDMRYSYFDTRNAIPTYRSLLSRRSSARPGKALSVRAWPQQLAWQPSPITSPLPFVTAADDHDSPSSLAESKDPGASLHSTVAAAPIVSASSTKPHAHDGVRSFIAASVAAVVHRGDQGVFSGTVRDQQDTQGTMTKHTSMSHVWPLLTEATAISLACVLKDMHHVLSATRTQGAEPFHLPLPSIDHLLQAIHEGLPSNEEPFHQSYGPATLILLSGLPQTVRSAVIRAFLSLVEVDDEAITAVFQRLLDPSGLTTVESLTLVAQLAAVPLNVRVDRISDVVDPQWKRSLCRVLQLDELQLRPAAVSVVDAETAENKSSNESAAPSPVNRMVADGDIVSDHATTAMMTTTTATSTAPNGDRRVSLSLEAFAAVVVDYAWTIPTPVHHVPLSEGSSGGYVSSPPPRGASDDKKLVERADTAKGAKKPSKFLSEMGPAIDRMPQLAQHRPSTSNQSSLSPRPGTSGRDTAEGHHSVDSNRPPPPPSRGRLTSSRPPPPLPTPVFAATDDGASTRRRHVGPLRLASPSQRSWIEDPIVRYSHMLGNERKSDDGAESNANESFVPVLVDLSDAIPNYDWRVMTSAFDDQRAVAMPQTVSDIVVSAVHLLQYHCRQLFANEELAFSNEIVFNDATTQPMVEALLDWFLHTAAVRFTSSTATSSVEDTSVGDISTLLWWVKRSDPPSSSIVQVVEQGLRTAEQWKHQPQVSLDHPMTYAAFMASSAFSLLQTLQRCDPEAAKAMPLDGQRWDLFQSGPLGSLCCRSDALDHCLTLEVSRASLSLVVLMGTRLTPSGLMLWLLLLLMCATDSRCRSVVRSGGSHRRRCAACALERCDGVACDGSVARRQFAQRVLCGGASGRLSRVAWVGATCCRCRCNDTDVAYGAPATGVQRLRHRNTNGSVVQLGLQSFRLSSLLGATSAQCLGAARDHRGGRFW